MCQNRSPNLTVEGWQVQNSGRKVPMKREDSVSRWYGESGQAIPLIVRSGYHALLESLDGLSGLRDVEEGQERNSKHISTGVEVQIVTARGM